MRNTRIEARDSGCGVRDLLRVGVKIFLVLILAKFSSKLISLLTFCFSVCLFVCLFFCRSLQVINFYNKRDEDVTVVVLEFRYVM